MTVQRIEREELAAQAQLFDELLRGGDLAALVAPAPGHLADHQARLGGKGRQPLQRRHVGKARQAAAQGLAVDGDGGPAPAGPAVERRSRALPYVQRRVDRTADGGPEDTARAAKP